MDAKPNLSNFSQLRPLVQITPAILTSSASELKELLLKYVAAGFDSIDIDIQEGPFASSDTLGFAEVFEVYEELQIELANVSIGWDLKLATPEIPVVRILELDRPQRIYVYQSADLEFMQNYNFEAEDLNLGLLDTDEVECELGFYSQFPEIQLMSVAAEQQGAQIEERLLEKIDMLRALGYEGIISIDGGVNIHSTAKVLQHAIDRVSVGSFFQKSDDVVRAKAELEAAFTS